MGDRPLVFMTQRRRLDAHPPSGRLPRARAVRGRVDEVLCENGHVTARLGHKVVRASVVVGAGGANGIVARASACGKDIMRGIALRGTLPGGDRRGRTARGRFMGAVPGGAGSFPRSHAVGVGGWGVARDFVTISPSGIVRSASHCAVGRQGHRRPRGAREGASRPAASSSSVTQPGWSTRSRATASTRRLSPDVSRRTQSFPAT